jgi:hypothetical protein
LSHSSTRGSRALTELTLKVAIFMGRAPKTKDPDRSGPVL